ncbi:MAG TPA: glycosyltransferase [Desulfatiglandales bacterium]|nr:glycosyltransferase [Desulfatiglandales bacterium]
MENFLGDLLPALRGNGADVAAVVHDHPSSGGQIQCNDAFPMVYRVPCYGSLMYAPVSPGFPLALSKVIRRFRPDILHLHMPNTSAFWVMALSCARQIPKVVHWHSDVVQSQIDRRISVAYHFYRPFERAILRSATSIIATSQSYLITSKALYPWRNKCKVVPLGLDPGRLKMPDAGLTKWADGIWGREKTRVLAIGRLTYYKGHEVLIKAAARLPDIKVLIIGEGERRTRLQNLIAELELRERVKLLGFMQEPRLQTLLATCDFLCLPSVERTEAFGLVLLEAMRFAKPVVASDVTGSGIGWVVRQKETGFLVPSEDSIELARTLQIMADGSKLRNRMGKAAAKRFDEVFHIDKVAQEIMVIYRAILRNET